MHYLLINDDQDLFSIAFTQIRYIVECRKKRSQESLFSFFLIPFLLTSDLENVITQKEKEKEGKKDR